MVLIRKLKSTLYFAVTSVTLCLNYVSSAPVTEDRWENPCGGRRPSGRVFLTTPIVKTSDRVLRKHLRIKMHELIQMLDALKERYAIERIQDPKLLESLEEYPTLKGFAATNTDTTSIFVDQLKKDYTRISTFAVFLKHLKQDEEKITASSFRPDIHRLDSTLYGLLCQLQNDVSNKGSDIDTYVTNDVMPSEYKLLQNAAERHQRDYLILKDGLKLLTELIPSYNSHV